MIFINEWLPNPTGNDLKGEFIELFNNDNTSVDLSGWKIGIPEKKGFSLNGYGIVGDSYLLLKRSETKIALKNSDASLVLYDPAGKIVDRSAFVGAAPERQSFSRINYGTDPSQHFVFAEPTPGGANNLTANIQITDNHYPLNIPLNPSPGVGTAIFMALSVGIALAGIMVYALKQDEELSELFFGRNQEIW